MPPTSKRDRLFDLIGKGFDQGAGAARDQMRPMDPLQSLLRGQAESRLETKELQNQYEHAGADPKARQKANALAEIDRLLQNPSNLTRGQLQTGLARAAGDVGALSEGDVNRALPTTLRSMASKAAGFVGFPNAINSLNNEEIEGIKQMIQSRREQLMQQEDAARQDVMARGPQIAPTLYATGRLKPTVEAMGGGLRQYLKPTGAPTGSNTDDARQKRLMELRAKKASGKLGQ